MAASARGSLAIGTVLPHPGLLRWERENGSQRLHASDIPGLRARPTHAVPSPSGSGLRWGGERRRSPPAILCGGTKPSTSTPRLIWRSWTETCCPIISAAAIGWIGFRTTPLLTRSPRSSSSVCQPRPPDSRVPAARLFSGLQCDGATRALHAEAKHPQPLLRSTGGAVPVASHHVYRHAKTSRENPRTAPTVFSTAYVVSFIRGHVASGVGHHASLVPRPAFQTGWRADDRGG